MKYIFLLLVCLFFFLWVKRKKNKQPIQEPQKPEVPRDPEEPQEPEEPEIPQEPEEPKEMPQTSKQTTIPAPVGGLNARDAIANMLPEYAIRMKNMFPTTRGVRVRKGVLDHVTGLSAVESLMPYSMPNGTETLFCAAGTAFYNVTTAGAVGAAVVSSLTNARWESVNFTNSSGTSYLCCFNGTNSPEYWDNSSWTAITGVSSPAITGVTPSNLFGPMIHKRRLWTIEVNTLKAWYLPVDAVGGAANALDLSGMAKNGGYLQAIGSYTIDGGSGPDDYWVGITSKGEAIVYKGTDPSSASTWALVGVWEIGVPLGRRCLKKYGGDLLVLTRDGIKPIPKALLAGNVDRTIELTDLIRDEISKLAKDYGGSFGWQMEYFSEANMLLLNTPAINSAKYLNFPGSSGDSISTPDSSALDITGDIDLRIEVYFDNSTPSDTILMGKWEAAGQLSWLIGFYQGFAHFYYSENGTTIKRTAASVIDLDGYRGERIWIRATVDVSVPEAKFYTSTDGENWTLEGTESLGVSAITFHSGTSKVEAGDHSYGTSFLGAESPLLGKIYNAKIYDGTTLVACLNDDDMVVDASTVTSASTGEVWTLNGNTSIAGTTTEVHQYAMNTVTNKWGGHWDITANCWAVFNNKLYYGGSDAVVQAWRSGSDNAGDISFDMIQAFNYFKSFGRIKQWHMIKPIFVTDGALTTVSIGLLIDYEDLDETVTATLAFKTPSISSWNGSIWEGTQATNAWQSVTGAGDCAALRIKGTVNGNSLEFIAASYLYEEGGVVG